MGLATASVSTPSCTSALAAGTAGRLVGKTAIVFGGTSGIGLATAIALREEGAKVLAVSRSPDKAAAVAEEHSIDLAACDVRDKEALGTLFQSHGTVDILVSAATGGERWGPSPVLPLDCYLASRPPDSRLSDERLTARPPCARPRSARGPFLQMDMEQYQASFDKLWGYANVVRFGVPQLAADGCVVLVSGSPARAAKPGQIALASVGAAVEQFARAVAVEVAPRRINVVSPGIVETAMFGEPSAERDAALSGATSSHLIPRPGTPEEVAAGVLFAVTNGFVTGTTIDVDGGWILRGR